MGSNHGLTGPEVSMMRVAFLIGLLAVSNSLLAGENNPLPVNWQELPRPYHTKSAVKPARMVEQPAGAALKVPAGFVVAEYMHGFDNPRYMIDGKNGEILLSDMDAGIVYRIENKQRQKLVTGLSAPYGLAIYKDWLYIADAKAVHRYYYNGQTIEMNSHEEVIDLSSYASGHITRTILFNEAEDKLYLSVGSRSNVDSGEPLIRAAITRYNPDGSQRELFAKGIRNGVGMAWNPVTGSLWVSSHERDGLGDDLVPDYFTEVQQGDFFGWPYAYIGPHEDPRHKGAAPDKVASTHYPDVLLGGHVGALDTLFYTGEQFPAKYKNGAFVAFHGSWNRSSLAGYKVAFIPFKEGKPIAGPEDFLTGWQLAPNKRLVWGRPVGLLQMADGSLLVTDDAAGRIWQVNYDKD